MRPDDRYGRLDRLLHRIAFRAGIAQRTLADVEELLFREEIDGVAAAEPVFITALPRTGTTILLNLLWETGRFASHTYRDMPFVMCPLLWSRYSERFVADDTPRERDHGDGLEVSGASPEAFEEMIWKEFWPAHYRDDRILPWTQGEASPDFEAFFEAHMRKIAFLRREGPSDRRRYLSKNNANIARLAGRPGPLGRGSFLVPFREPVQHAASMHRQHRRFTRIHDENPFTRRYMAAIGHHEFGRGLRPIDFGGWLDDAPPPDGLEFWIRYWNAAYAFVLEHAGPGVTLVSYEELVREPERVLARLADVLAVPRAELTSLAGRLRPPRRHPVDLGDVDGAVVEASGDLHRRLQRAVGSRARSAR